MKVKEPIELANTYLDKSGYYYFRKMIGNRRYKQSLGVRPGAGTTKTLLRQLMDAKIAAIKRGDPDEQKKTMVQKGYPTIGELKPIFERMAKRKRLATRTTQGYYVALSRVITNALGRRNVDAQSVKILTPNLLTSYVDKMLDAPLPEKHNAMEKRRRSLTSEIRNARGMFSRKALRLYKEQGFCLPDSIINFRTCDVIDCKQKRYRIPPIGLRTKTLAAGAILERANKPFWRVWLLSLYLALRAGESENARYSWITTDSIGQHYIEIIDREDEEFYCKGTEGRVPIPKKVHASLMALRRDDDPYILPGGSFGARRKLVEGSFSSWMRHVGWDAKTYERTNHELRAWRGSIWYSREGDGLSAAVSRLRHKDPKVTKDSYADFIDHVEPLPLDD